MNIIKSNSIRHRFTFALATVITLVMLVFSVGVILYNSQSVEKDLHKQMNKLTVFSTESLSIALWQFNYGYIKDYINSLLLYEDIAFASVLVKNKEIVKKVRPGFKELLFSEFSTSSRFISKETAIIHNGVSVGVMRLVISRGRIRNLIISTSTLTILTLLLVNLTVFGTNYFLSNWYLFKPLAKLEGSVKEISSGKLDSPIDVSGNDEIGQLAQSFKHMMDNIKNITASRDELNHEIQERKQAVNLIKAALKEKEVLFKEIHHRVKNNMQIIQSLLSLQSNKIFDPKHKKPLIDSNNRIKSMALIHEILYRSDNMAVLDIQTYFNEIVQHLFRIYREPGCNVAFNLDIDTVQMGMDMSIACGLILNELVSNALKYAFISDSKGDLFISLKTISANEVLMTVKDNGPGLPTDLDLNTSDSLGFKIVKILVAGQLKGNVKVKNDKGALFEICFPFSIG